MAQIAVAFVSRLSEAETREEQISELFVLALTSSPREGQSVLGRAAKAPIERPDSSRTIQPQPEYEAFFASAANARKEREETQLGALFFVSPEGRSPISSPSSSRFARRAQSAVS